MQASAEDYNHDLIAVAGGSGEDTAPAGEPAVGGAGQRHAQRGEAARQPARFGRSAAGTPAAALAAAVAGEAEVTVRLRETSGRPTTARVRLAQPVSAAWLTDLLEETDDAPLPVVDGAVMVDMPAFNTVTLVLRTGSRAAGNGGLAAVEPVQPVYARYWLHGKGPAPAGNLPVAVHFSPGPGRPGRAGPGRPAAR